VTSAGFNAIPDLGDLTGLYFPGLTFLSSIGYFLSANTDFCSTGLLIIGLTFV
jgi:hypothetical protein